MRVYISADMEGVTGLVGAEDVQAGGLDYERGRVMMTGDVNAAVRGALAAGAAQVLVNDAHSSMRNLLADQIHPEAALVRGKPKPMGMLEGLDGSFGALLCVGYHARALRDSRTAQVSGPVPQLFRLFGVFMRVATSLTGQHPYC
ncbi:MAG TPA: M55 family metallopeptidase [Streptosporangiaceae bacterium]